MNKKSKGKSHSHRGKKTIRGAKGGKFPSPKAGTSLPASDVLIKTNESSMRDDGSQETNTPKRLMEKDVGITEYISQHSGFGGIIKQRFSDFHVNEIDNDGNIVTLTTVVPPEPVAEVNEGKEEAEEYLKTVLPSDTFEQLKQLIESAGDDLEIEASGMSKDDRRKLHTSIHAIGKHQLVSNTKDKDGKKLITISKCKHNVKPDRRQAWPAERGGEYVYFVLHKENMDTMETVNYIASKLRMKSNMINYAGTKDRRGKTSQLMSVWRVEPNKLASLNRVLRGVTLGNYSFRSKGLKLGDLRGNRFRIVLRNVTGTEDQIEEAMTSLKENGFLNYYGLQRFGSSVAVPTYDVGKALLQGDWKQAVELILKPREGEQNYEMAEARKVWWETRDALKAFKILRNKDKLIEGKLLLGLSRHGANNYIAALENIPRNTRLLYLHSYQSLLWNRVVSRRVSEFSLKPMAGDLVLLGDSKPEIVEDPTEDDSSTSTADSEETSPRKSMVKVLSEADLANVSMSDIVVPLPGFDIVYPNNVLKHWFEELLSADGLSSAGLKQAVRKYSLSGAYRKILVHPSNVSWKTMHYTDPQATLVLSDVEIMRKVEPPKDKPDGAYRALILDLCLPSSTYATMALREVLKADTSSLHQASLNDYHSFKGDDISKKCVVKEQTSSPETGEDIYSKAPKMITRRLSGQKLETAKCKGKTDLVISRQEENKVVSEEATSLKKVKAAESIVNKVDLHPVKNKGKRTLEHHDVTVVKSKDISSMKKIKTAGSDVEDTSPIRTRGKRSSEHFEVCDPEIEAETVVKLSPVEYAMPKKAKTNDQLSCRTRSKLGSKLAETSTESESEDTSKTDIEESVSEKKKKVYVKASVHQDAEGEMSEDSKADSEDTSQLCAPPIRTRSKGVPRLREGNKSGDDSKGDSEDSSQETSGKLTRSKASKGCDTHTAASEPLKDELKLKQDKNSSFSKADVGEENGSDRPSMRTRSRALTKVRETSADSEGGTEDEEVKGDMSSGHKKTETTEGSALKTRSKGKQSEAIEEIDHPVENTKLPTVDKELKVEDKLPARTRLRATPKAHEAPSLVTEDTKESTDNTQILLRPRLRVSSRRDSPLSEKVPSKETDETKPSPVGSPELSPAKKKAKMVAKSNVAVDIVTLPSELEESKKDGKLKSSSRNTNHKSKKHNTNTQEQGVEKSLHPVPSTPDEISIEEDSCESSAPVLEKCTATTTEEEIPDILEAPVLKREEELVKSFTESGKKAVLLQKTDDLTSTPHYQSTDSNEKESRCNYLAASVLPSCSTRRNSNLRRAREKTAVDKTDLFVQHETDSLTSGLEKKCNANSKALETKLLSLAKTDESHNITYSKDTENVSCIKEEFPVLQVETGNTNSTNPSCDCLRVKIYNSSNCCAEHCHCWKNVQKMCTCESLHESSKHSPLTSPSRKMCQRILHLDCVERVNQHSVACKEHLSETHHPIHVHGACKSYSITSWEDVDDPMLMPNITPAHIEAFSNVISREDHTFCESQHENQRTHYKPCLERMEECSSPCEALKNKTDTSPISYNYSTVNGKTSDCETNGDQLSEQCDIALHEGSDGLSSNDPAATAGKGVTVILDQKDSSSVDSNIKSDSQNDEVVVANKHTDTKSGIEAVKDMQSDGDTVDCDISENACLLQINSVSVKDSAPATTQESKFSEPDDNMKMQTDFNDEIVEPSKVVSAETRPDQENISVVSAVQGSPVINSDTLLERKLLCKARKPYSKEMEISKSELQCDANSNVSESEVPVNGNQRRDGHLEDDRRREGDTDIAVCSSKVEESDKDTSQGTDVKTEEVEHCNMNQDVSHTDSESLGEKSELNENKNANIQNEDVEHTPETYLSLPKVSEGCKEEDSANKISGEELQKTDPVDNLPTKLLPEVETIGSDTENKLCTPPAQCSTQLEELDFESGKREEDVTLAPDEETSQKETSVGELQNAQDSDETHNSGENHEICESTTAVAEVKLPQKTEVKCIEESQKLSYSADTPMDENEEALSDLKNVYPTLTENKKAEIVMNDTQQQPVDGEGMNLEGSGDYPNVEGSRTHVTDSEQNSKDMDVERNSENERASEELQSSSELRRDKEVCQNVPEIEMKDVGVSESGPNCSDDTKMDEDGSCPVDISTERTSDDSKENNKDKSMEPSSADMETEVEYKQDKVVNEEKGGTSESSEDTASSQENVIEKEDSSKETTSDSRGTCINEKPLESKTSATTTNDAICGENLEEPEIVTAASRGTDPSSTSDTVSDVISSTDKNQEKSTVDLNEVNEPEERDPEPCSQSVAHGSSCDESDVKTTELTQTSSDDTTVNEKSDIRNTSGESDLDLQITTENETACVEDGVETNTPNQETIKENQDSASGDGERSVKDTASNIGSEHEKLDHAMDSNMDLVAEKGTSRINSDNPCVTVNTAEVAHMGSDVELTNPVPLEGGQSENPILDHNSDETRNVTSDADMQTGGLSDLEVVEKMNEESMDPKYEVMEEDAQDSNDRPACEMDVDIKETAVSSPMTEEAKVLPSISLKTEPGDLPEKDIPVNSAGLKDISTHCSNVQPCDKEQEGNSEPSGDGVSDNELSSEGKQMCSDLADVNSVAQLTSHDIEIENNFKEGGSNKNSKNSLATEESEMECDTAAMEVCSIGDRKVGDSSEAADETEKASQNGESNTLDGSTQEDNTGDTTVLKINDLEEQDSQNAQSAEKSEDVDILDAEGTSAFDEPVENTEYSGDKEDDVKGDPEGYSKHKGLAKEESVLEKSGSTGIANIVTEEKELDDPCVPPEDNRGDNELSMFSPVDGIEGENQEIDMHMECDKGEEEMVHESDGKGEKDKNEETTFLNESVVPSKKEEAPKEVVPQDELDAITVHDHCESDDNKEKLDQQGKNNVEEDAIPNPDKEPGELALLNEPNVINNTSENIEEVDLLKEQAVPPNNKESVTDEPDHLEKECDVNMPVQDEPNEGTRDDNEVDETALFDEQSKKSNENAGGNEMALLCEPSKEGDAKEKVMTMGVTDASGKDSGSTEDMVMLDEPNELEKEEERAASPQTKDDKDDVDKEMALLDEPGVSDRKETEGNELALLHEPDVLSKIGEGIEEVTMLNEQELLIRDEDEEELALLNEPDGPEALNEANLDSKDKKEAGKSGFLDESSMPSKVTEGQEENDLFTKDEKEVEESALLEEQIVDRKISKDINKEEMQGDTDVLSNDEEDGEKMTTQREPEARGEESESELALLDEPDADGKANDAVKEVAMVDEADLLEEPQEDDSPDDVDESTLLDEPDLIMEESTVSETTVPAPGEDEVAGTVAAAYQAEDVSNNEELALLNEPRGITEAISEPIVIDKWKNVETMDEVTKIDMTEDEEMSAETKGKQLSMSVLPDSKDGFTGGTEEATLSKECVASGSHTQNCDSVGDNSEIVTHAKEAENPSYSENLNVLGQDALAADETVTESGHVTENNPCSEFGEQQVSQFNPESKEETLAMELESEEQIMGGKENLTDLQTHAHKESLVRSPAQQIGEESILQHTSNSDEENFAQCSSVSEQLHRDSNKSEVKTDCSAPMVNPEAAASNSTLPLPEDAFMEDEGVKQQDSILKVVCDENCEEDSSLEKPSRAKKEEPDLKTDRTEQKLQESEELACVNNQSESSAVPLLEGENDVVPESETNKDEEVDAASITELKTEDDIAKGPYQKPSPEVKCAVEIAVTHKQETDMIETVCKDSKDAQDENTRTCESQESGEVASEANNQETVTGKMSDDDKDRERPFFQASEDTILSPEQDKSKREQDTKEESENEISQISEGIEQSNENEKGHTCNDMPGTQTESINVGKENGPQTNPTTSTEKMHDEVSNSEACSISPPDVAQAVCVTSPSCDTNKSNRETLTPPNDEKPDKERSDKSESSVLVHRWSQNGTVGGSGQSTSQAKDLAAEQFQDPCGSSSSANSKEVSEETVKLADAAPRPVNTDSQTCSAPAPEQKDLCDLSADNSLTDKEPAAQEAECLCQTQMKEQEELGTSGKNEMVTGKPQTAELLSSAGEELKTKELSQSGKTPGRDDETSSTEVCDKTKESDEKVGKTPKPKDSESSVKILPRCKDISVALISEELSSSHSGVKKSSGEESLRKWDCYTSGPSTSRFISGPEQETVSDGVIKDATPLKSTETQAQPVSEANCKPKDTGLGDKDLPGTKSVDKDQLNDSKDQTCSDIVSSGEDANSKQENNAQDSAVKRKGDKDDTESCEFEAKRICFEQENNVGGENTQEIIDETEELPCKNETENITAEGGEEKIDESVRKRKVPGKGESTSEIKKLKLSRGNSEATNISTDVME